MSKLVKLTGLKSYIGGIVGNFNIEHGDIIRVSDEDADRLLNAERQGPPEVDPIKYFTEVKEGPNVYVKYDFVNKIKINHESATTTSLVDGVNDGNPDADEDPSDSQQPAGVTKVEAKARRKQQQEVPVTRKVRAAKTKADDAEE